MTKFALVQYYIFKAFDQNNLTQEKNKKNKIFKGVDCKVFSSLCHEQQSKCRLYGYEVVPYERIRKWIKGIKWILST